MVLLPDHHEGYISWEQYQRNRARIRDNAMKNGLTTTGAARSGQSLLTGLLRCGRCGRKLHVHYSGAEKNVPRYECKGTAMLSGYAPCIAIGGLRIDAAIEQKV